MLFQIVNCGLKAFNIFLELSYAHIAKMTQEAAYLSGRMHVINMKRYISIRRSATNRALIILAPFHFFELLNRNSVARAKLIVSSCALALFTFTVAINEVFEFGLARLCCFSLIIILAQILLVTLSATGSKPAALRRIGIKSSGRLQFATHRTMSMGFHNSIMNHASIPERGNA